MSTKKRIRKRKCKPPKYRGFRKTGRTKQGLRPCKKKTWA